VRNRVVQAFIGVSLLLSQSLLYSAAVSSSGWPDVKLTTKEIHQGDLVYATVHPANARVTVDGRLIKTDREGRFVFGVGRDRSKDLVIVVQLEGQRFRQSIPILKRQWKIERIDGLPQDKVTPTAPELLKRIAEESKKVRKIRQNSWFPESIAKTFIVPSEGRISGVYGSQRILNGEPKSPHYGLDIANKIGTPVYAPAAGVIRLAESLYYSGNTVIIDHGFGLFSSLLHLDSFQVAVGERVEQGQLIGRIGASGRATGPHLDWRVNWFDVRVDPAQLIAEIRS